MKAPTKFRKKPVVVEAVLAVEIIAGEVAGFTPPGWIHDAIKSGDLMVFPERLSIRTLEGIMYADVSDWIIRGVKGEIYPCKPDIFEATYEVAG